MAATDAGADGGGTAPPADGSALVVVAASAGGVHALRTLLEDLPAGLPCPLVVVQHLSPRHPSHLAEIMARHTALQVREARDGEALRPAMVLIAPPDRHVLVNGDGTVTLAHTEKVHFVRPSADVLFASAAAAYGASVVAVVLSGTGEDGSVGVTAVKRMGGRVIVQDEATAEFFGMPAAAIRTGMVDDMLPLGRIGRRIGELVGRRT